ncbi:hypothetical protein [Streptomyces sp. NPDC088748]|uniref:hypothetical protein n=1 Tax=Streptomyces sp. NPDC088748 TaxID=3365887 RepID=UPI00380DBA37
MIDDHADAAWERQLEDLFLRIGHRFGRADLRRGGRDCIRGLLAPVGRKNAGNWPSSPAIALLMVCNGC